MDTKTTYLWTVICPKKLTLAHNVFEVTELCRTRADILKPSLDRTLVVSQITKIQTKNKTKQNKTNKKKTKSQVLLGPPLRKQNI